MRESLSEFYFSKFKVCVYSFVWSLLDFLRLRPFFLCLGKTLQPDLSVPCVPGMYLDHPTTHRDTWIIKELRTTARCWLSNMFMYWAWTRLCPLVLSSADNNSHMFVNLSCFLMCQWWAKVNSCLSWTEISFKGHEMGGTHATT